MRTTVTVPDAEYRKVRALADEEHRRPNEMLVLLARESLGKRLEGAARVRRFRAAMGEIFGGLDEATVRGLDAREVEPRPKRRR